MYYINDYSNTHPLLYDEWILLWDKFIFTSLAQMDKLKFWKKYEYLFRVSSWFSPGKVKFGVTRPDEQVGS